MKKATDEELSKLHLAASDVYNAIKSGADVNDSIIKVAKREEYNENWTRRLCEISNRLLTLDHMENAEGKKVAAEHELVDIEKVVDDLFPKSINKKVAHVYKPIDDSIFLV